MEIKAGHSKKEERNVAQRLYIVLGVAIFAVLIVWGMMLRKGAVPDMPAPPMPAGQAQDLNPPPPISDVPAPDHSPAPPSKVPPPDHTPPPPIEGVH